MVKETLKYKDYNGIEREEDFYFNLSETELAEMELTTVGGLSAIVDKIIKTDDIPGLFKLFKDIVLKSYGEKSADGRRFVKTGPNGEKLSTLFVETEAYNVLMMKLATDAEYLAEFMNCVIPKVQTSEEADSKKIEVVE